MEQAMRLKQGENRTLVEVGENVTEPPLYDYNRLEIAFAGYLEASPGVKREDAFLAFQAGWLARVTAARESLGSYSMDAESAAVFELIRLLEKEASTLRNRIVALWRGSNARERRIAKLEAALLETGANLEDVPLYRRIGQQRREIERLHKLIESQK